MKAVWKGKTLAETDHAVPLEGNQYFPPDSVRMDFLRDGSALYTCPWKGEAKYYAIEVDGEVNDNAAWSYPEPKEAARMIEKHIAFDQSKGIEITE